MAGVVKFIGKEAEQTIGVRSLGCVHTGSERFFGVSDGVTTYGHVTP